MPWCSPYSTRYTMYGVCRGKKGCYVSEIRQVHRQAVKQPHCKHGAPSASCTCPVVIPLVSRLSTLDDHLKLRDASAHDQRSFRTRRAIHPHPRRPHKLSSDDIPTERSNHHPLPPCRARSQPTKVLNHLRPRQTRPTPFRGEHAHSYPYHPYIQDNANMSEERLWKFSKPEWLTSVYARNAGVYASGALVSVFWGRGRRSGLLLP